MKTHISDLSFCDLENLVKVIDKAQVLAPLVLGAPTYPYWKQEGNKIRSVLLSRVRLATPPPTPPDV